MPTISLHIFVPESLYYYLLLYWQNHSKIQFIPETRTDNYDKLSIFPIKIIHIRYAAYSGEEEKNNWQLSIEDSQRIITYRGVN